jgi:hypothetical protein
MPVACRVHTRVNACAWPARASVKAMTPEDTARKFLPAMIAYGVLGVIAWFWLAGTPRIAVLVLLGGLAAKTIIAKAAGW